MNFESLKLGFISYLEEKLKDDDKGIEAKEQISNSGISIFMYSSEFKDYLVEEVGADTSIFSKSISEIMEMDFVNGKLVEAEDTDTNSDSFEKESDNEDSDFLTGALNEILSDETVISALDADKSGDLNKDELNTFLQGISDDETESVSFDKLSEAVNGIQNGTYNPENPQLENDSTEKKEPTEQDKINELLAKAYENKTVLKALDTDGDGKLSDEEKAKFEEFIKGYDGDPSKLTENDVKKAVEEILDGKFSYDKDLNHAEDKNDEIVSENPPEESASSGGATETTTPSQQPGGTSSSGGSSFNPSTSSGTSSSTDSSSNVSDEMTLEELESEKRTKESEVADAQEGINAVYNGENEAVKAAQNDYEDAKKAYDEAVENDDKISDELKDKREDNLNQIDDKENQINDLNVKINDQNALITEQKSTIAEDESNLNALNSALKDLPKESDFPDDAEKRNEIANKKKELEAAINEAEEKLTADNEKLDELEEDLKELESSLNTAEDELEKLETVKSEIEDEILKNCSPETKEALENFNKAKENVDKVKEDELKTAQKTLSDAQSELDKINTQINEKKAEKTKEDNTVKTATLKDGIFSENGALAGKEDLVAEIADKYGIEPEFLAAIICLETGYGESNLAMKYNNFGGVTGSGDAGSVNTSTGYTFAAYTSIEKGLDAMAKNLASYSTRYSEVNAVDIDNVEAIGSHYCVGGDWANKVKSLYNKIKNG